MPTTHIAPKHYPIRAALVAIATITIMVFGGISEMMKPHTGDTMSTEQLIPQIPLWCSSALKPITGTDRTKAAEMFRDWMLEKQETLPDMANELRREMGGLGPVLNLDSLPVVCGWPKPTPGVVSFLMNHIRPEMEMEDTTAKPYLAWGASLKISMSMGIWNHLAMVANGTTEEENRNRLIRYFECALGWWENPKIPIEMPDFMIQSFKKHNRVFYNVLNPEGQGEYQPLPPP